MLHFGGGNSDDASSPLYDICLYVCLLEVWLLARSCWYGMYRSCMCSNPRGRMNKKNAFGRLPQICLSTLAVFGFRTMLFTQSWTGYRLPVARYVLAGPAKLHPQGVRSTPLWIGPELYQADRIKPAFKSIPVNCSHREIDPRWLGDSRQECQRLLFVDTWSKSDNKGRSCQFIDR